MLHVAAIFCRNGCPTPRPTTNKPELLSLAAMRIAVVSIFVLLLAAARASVFELKNGDWVVFVGDSLIEGERSNGWIETMLTARFEDRALSFRNLGWSGDTPAGDSRFGLSLLQAGREPAGEGWKQLVRQIESIKPTVVFVGYGMASSMGTAWHLKLARERSDTLPLKPSRIRSP